MRISTSTLYATSTSQLGTLQSQLARTQQQLASGRRILSAADDPIASARALEVAQSKSINAQFATNRQSARSALSQEEVALTSIQSLVQDVQVIAVAAGNGVNSTRDRASYVNELEGRLDDLMALANSSDGTGGYLFAGFKSTTVPFVKSGQSVVYKGDQGQVQLQVGSARQLAISDSGSSVFTNLTIGNGGFVTSAAPTNSGTAVVSAGSVADASQITGHRYQIDFTVAGTPATTTYTISDLDAPLTPPAVPPSLAYTSGAPITYQGMSFDISGAPADGDKVNLDPSPKPSLFSTLSDMIATLRAPVFTDADKTALAKGLNDANVNLSAALDNVLTVRSSLGSRMRELDNLDTAGDEADIQYAATLSDLQDLDWVKTISLFTQQQTSLDAAQKTFKAVSGLSLFNYIG